MRKEGNDLGLAMRWDRLKEMFLGQEVWREVEEQEVESVEREVRMGWEAKCTGQVPCVEGGKHRFRVLYGEESSRWEGGWKDRVFPQVEM